ncbi:MAG: PorV/PorQ family protein, partial [Kiritimatiellota bacterium]|nr:PorV/PorQ family protein [Kiritimatiellota bacterium]
MAIGVGARALGMGKAYVGVAEDGDAIFMNPAGIARINNPKLASMYTSLMGDVNYVVVGGAYPTGNRSAVGLGWISASTGDITLTSVAGTVEAGKGTWGNNVLFLSYGTYLPQQLLQRDVLVGANLKYYSVGGDGSSTITSANGTGYGVDLSMLYPATNYLLVGANYQNAIGGKITNKTSGATDDLAQNLKLGTKITLLGREGEAAAVHNTRKLYANVDYDLAMNGSRANVLHLGTEFWPTSNLALRAGSDNNELTAGLGLRYSGIEFNYAYHPYAGINEDATHFFSIGYLGEATKRALRVQVDSPADKSVIHEDSVKVKGRV